MLGYFHLNFLYDKDAAYFHIMRHAWMTSEMAGRILVHKIDAKLTLGVSPCGSAGEGEVEL